MSAAATATATASKKKIAIQGTAGTRHAEYNPISDSFLRANPKSVITAVIHGMNAHCADMLITMLDIMADKYGHQVNDLIDAVKGDDRWKAVTEHPVLNSLGYFDQEDADRVIGKKTAASKPTEELHDEVKPAKAAKPTLIEEAAAVPEVNPKKTTKKAAAAAAAAAVEEAPVEAASEPEVKPKKATKKAAAAAEETPVEEAAPEAKPKKTTKKTAAAAAAVEEAPVEAAPAPEAKPKKTTKKAATAAAPDAVVDALTESVAKMTTEESDATPAPAKKKVVSKKPVVKSA